MNNERWHEIESIFFSAAELGHAEREGYLRKACGNDNVLYQEVAALLEEHDSPSVLKTPIFDLGMQVLNKEAGGDRRTGTTVGQFRIEQLIGRGGMADIYRAKDTVLDQTVAVKVLSVSFAIDPERVRRFRREAAAVSRISHPNVAQFYGFYTVDGENLIAMELVEGTNLRQAMAAKLDFGTAIDIAIQATSALAAAHAAGVVHRDIKPENIIIRPDGIVKVLDFGLAKLVGPISASSNADESSGPRPTLGMSTEHGMLVGTPAYMSPEQIRAGDIDSRTDIWSVGVVLYEMLSGELPFRGPTKIDSIASILMSETPTLELGNVPGSSKVHTVVKRCLRKDKDERFESAAELLTNLQEIENGASSGAMPLGRRNTFRQYAPWAAMALAAILGIAAVAGLWLSTKRDRGVATTFPPTVPLPVRDGLISYWTADGDTRDSVGTNHGELINGAKYRPGVSGAAFSFDGVDDLFRANTEGFPTGNQERTVAVWAIVDEFVSEEAPFAVYGAPNHGQAFVVGTSEKHPFISNWGGSVPESAIATGRWHHIVAVTIRKSEGTSTAYLYVNGTLANHADLLFNTPAGTPFYSGTTPFGRETDGIRRLKGGVDEISIYSRALSHAEIQELYSAVGAR